MKIKAKKIRIEFNNSSEDYWEASCGSGIEFDEAMRMITRAWEEHDESAEPLIKDEKIRKAVRAWAEADDLDNFRVQNQHFNECKIIGYTAGINKASFIGFQTTIAHVDNKKLYTIAELCGEEEAPEPIEPTFIDLDERIKEKEGK